ncbi:hypothetical protein [Sedimenticola hydrogenitrophicus]|uniref:hypothetical protein n=1 Tax=Sedimenticola hydrogenitrophicus TaxID=2967975 RepID=UPI0021A84211|nr:hypothetical protein [Sedimenticola hydrogenitrophicus]
MTKKTTDDAVENLRSAQDRGLHACYDERPDAPSDVWNHRDYGSWKTSIWGLIEDFATPEVVESFLAAPPEDIVSDDPSWLEEIVHRVRNEAFDMKSLLANRLRERYSAIRAVHGTRTDDVERFYGEGLKPLQPEKFHRQARLLFLQGKFPELNESSLQAAIHQVGSDLREGRVYFEANEEMLLTYCGHYMIYGSEYLTSLAAQIGSKRDYRQVLTTYGKPTVLVCDVPLELISDYTLEEFSGWSLEALFQELLEGSDFQINPSRGAGFCIRSRLDPHCIVGHYHPESIRDPLTGIIHRWRIS